MVETHKKEHEHHEKKNDILSKDLTLKLDKWQIISIVLALLLIISIFTGGLKFNFNKSNTGKDVVDYLNNYLLAGQGIKASFSEISEESGLYKIKLDVGGRTFDSYATKDGKLLFPSAVDLTQKPTLPTAQPQEKVEVSADDDPVKGDKNAPVTIIEFSDFQCPFCGKFYKETLPEIDEKYIKTGKAKLVYRDYPLGSHEFAQKAAEAAECADEQGKFWQYHDKLFENQDALTIDNLKRYARDTGLSASKFNDCLDSSRYKDEVNKDLKDGESYGVSGTPAFFINGNLISGAQPFSAFEQVIEAELIK